MFVHWGWGLSGCSVCVAWAPVGGGLVSWVFGAVGGF